MEKVKCNTCGAEYTDPDSIQTVKNWLSGPEGYAPCPNISCPGQLEVIENQERR
ncbi:hypothetical protein ES707_19879 [subsurface metagenome]